MKSIKILFECERTAPPPTLATMHEWSRADPSTLAEALLQAASVDRIDSQPIPWVTYLQSSSQAMLQKQDDESAREELVALLRIARTCCTAGSQACQALLDFGVIHSICHDVLPRIHQVGVNDASGRAAAASIAQTLCNAALGCEQDATRLEQLWSIIWPEPLSILATSLRPAVLTPLCQLLLVLLPSAVTPSSTLRATALVVDASLETLLANVTSPEVPPDDACRALLCALVERLALHYQGLSAFHSDKHDATTRGTFFDCLTDAAHQALDAGNPTHPRQAKDKEDNDASLASSLSVLTPYLSLPFLTSLHTLLLQVANQVALAQRLDPEAGKKMTHDDPNGLISSLPRSVLAHAVKILRLVTSHERLVPHRTVIHQEDDDMAVHLWTSGLLTTLVTLLAALRPIENPRRPFPLDAPLLPPDSPEEMDHATAAANPPGWAIDALRPGCTTAPLFSPYASYRTDLVGALANPPFRRTWLQNHLSALSLPLILLAQCQLDDTSPLCREWALWAVRNLCQGNEAVQATLAELKPQDVIESPELKAMGMHVSVDQRTGKITLEKEKDK